MSKLPKKKLIEIFLEKKNMQWKDCTKRQKMIFNDTPSVWYMYEWN